MFGGFILGAAMPRGFFAQELRKRLEPIVVTVLLPVFFCFSGLNTQLTMVNNVGLVLITLAILAASILGKGVACYLAARATGQDNSTALGIGALMNARGLMELIIINIGLQKGVIETPLFSMLVLMAVITTLMASPLFELVYGKKARERGELGALADVEEIPSDSTGPVRTTDLTPASSASWTRRRHHGHHGLPADPETGAFLFPDAAVSVPPTQARGFPCKPHKGYSGSNVSYLGLPSARSSAASSAKRPPRADAGERTRARRRDAALETDPRWRDAEGPRARLHGRAAWHRADRRSDAIGARP